MEDAACSKTNRDVWINPTGLARNLGFSPRELRKIESIVSKNEQQILEAWNEYFGH